jgi:MFS family permease
LSERSAGRLAWSLAGLTVGLDAAAVVLMVAANEQVTFEFNGPIFAAAIVAFAILGALLASRRPHNAMGWIFLAAAVLFAVNILADHYAHYGLVTNPGSLAGAGIASWLVLWEWTAGTGLILVYSLLLFPDGHLPSRRWRPLAWLAAIAIGVAMLGPAVAGWPLRGPRLLYPNEPPPRLPAAFRLSLGLQVIAVLSLFVMGLLAAVSLVVRRRRAAGEEREQIRWFAYGGFLLIASVITSMTTNLSGIGILGMLAVPSSATIAILKYRLYDIDVVINKTVVYGVLAACFTAVYVAIVVGIGSAVGSRSSRPLTVLAAVVMAVAFQPLREGARRFANRVVYGKRATPYEVLSEFAERMAVAYSTEDVLPRMAQILAGGTGATVARVWLRIGDRLRVAASWPQGAALPEELPIEGEELPPFPNADDALPVLHHGELLGALSVSMPPNEPLGPAQEKLIRDLASRRGWSFGTFG